MFTDFKNMTESQILSTVLPDLVNSNNELKDSLINLSLIICESAEDGEIETRRLNKLFKDLSRTQKRLPYLMAGIQEVRKRN